LSQEFYGKGRLTEDQAFKNGNYDTNVANEIPPLSDADGDGNVDCFEDFYPVKLWGDNHCGYIGFRNPSTGSFRDDGAMNLVIRNWMKP
jgi:hypothetical protein